MKCSTGEKLKKKNNFKFPSKATIFSVNCYMHRLCRYLPRKYSRDKTMGRSNANHVTKS